MHQAPYGTYQPPRRKRGLKRIIFGALGIVANGIGLIVMPFVAGIAVAVVALLSAAPVPLGGATGTFDASASSLHYVYVPAAEVGSATCTAEGGSGVLWEPDEETMMPTTVDGVEYAPVGTVTVSADQQVTITCEGVDDVAVADIGLMGTLIAFGVGVVIPLVLGLLAVVLLVWGIIARVRS